MADGCRGQTATDECCENASPQDRAQFCEHLVLHTRTSTAICLFLLCDFCLIFFVQVTLSDFLVAHECWKWTWCLQLSRLQSVTKACCYAVQSFAVMASHITRFTLLNTFLMFTFTYSFMYCGKSYSKSLFGSYVIPAGRNSKILDSDATPAGGV